MSFVNKSVLCWVALVSACDAGAMLNDKGDMAPVGDGPSSADLAVAGTTVDVNFSMCSAGTVIGSGIDSISVKQPTSSTPLLDYNVTTSCITSNSNKGATGYRTLDLTCMVDPNTLGPNFLSSTSFMLSFDEKSVTPWAFVVKDATNNYFQSIQSAIKTEVPNTTITPNPSSSSANTDTGGFVARQIVWKGRQTAFSVTFTGAVSCVKNYFGDSVLPKDPVTNVHWEIKNLKLTMSP